MRFFTQLLMISVFVLTASCNGGGGSGGGSKAPKKPEDRTENPQTTPETPTTPTDPTPTPTDPTPTPTEPTPTPTPTPTPNPDTGSTPPTGDIVIRAAAEFVDITDDVRKDKLERSIQLLENVLNSKIFRERTEAYTYNGEKTFVDNKDQTNAMIFQAIQNASETLTPGNDHMVNVQLTFYRASNSTVGYTTPTTRLIKINLKFFDQYSLSEVAGNLAHEWTHKLGYTHASRHNSARPHSVPYAVGYMVRDIGEDLSGE